MNPPATSPKHLWRKPWKDPRVFFLWLISLSILATLPMVTGHHISPGAQRVRGIVLGCALAGFLAGILGLLLSLTPRLRPVMHWLIRRSAFFAVCLVTLIALFYAAENWRGKRAWEMFRHEQEARGERFDVVSFAPPPVPDEQNFAMAPLIKPVFDFARTPEGLRWRDTNGYSRLLNIRPDLEDDANRTAGFIGEIEEGTFTDLEAARVFYQGNTNYPQPARAGTAAESVLVALGRFDVELKELHDAVARPASRFPLEYGHEMPVSILLPHLNVLKQMGLCLQLRATARLESGLSQPALEDARLIFRVADSIHDEPCVISQIVRGVVAGMGLQVLREGLVRHAWSDAQLGEFQKQLHAIDLLPGLKKALRAELGMDIVTIDWCRRRSLEFDPELLLLNRPTNFVEAVQVHLMPYMPDGWYYQSMLAVARLYQPCVLGAVDESAHRIFPDLSDKAEPIIRSMNRSPRNVFPRLLLPGLGKASSRVARLQFLMEAGMVACALDRYRLINGGLPESLSALTPQFIATIPKDLVDVRALHYRKRGDGYLVYSVGWNMADDGGEVVSISGEKPSVDARKGDWVWQLPAR
jgi:hypothetical protein